MGRKLKLSPAATKACELLASGPGLGVNLAHVTTTLTRPELLGGPADEYEFQKQLHDFAQARGWAAFSVPDSRRATAGGFPDSTFRHDDPPRIVVAELKMPGEVPRPDQELWLAAWRAMGVPAVCWTPDDWPEIRAVLAAAPEEFEQWRSRTVKPQAATAASPPTS